MRKEIVWSGVLSFLFFQFTIAQPIYIGTSIVDITPQRLPVGLDGLMQLRISSEIESPLEADIIVLESRLENDTKEIVVFVSCDLVTIPTEIRDLIRNKVKNQMPDFNIQNIIVNATHTHDAPIVRKDWYIVPEEVLAPEDYIDFITDRIVTGVVDAWEKREKGSMTWGVTEGEKVAYNRRAIYEDGAAKMWGETNVENFKTVEGYEDQHINTLFFWNEEGVLSAICVNVASPAQASRATKTINSDYMHSMRESLRKQFGKNLCILSWIAAAGDMTAMPLYGRKAQERMFKLQGLEYEDSRGVDHSNMIGLRVADAVLETYEIVKNDKYKEVVFECETDTIYLPMRIVNREEYESSKQIRDQDLSDPDDKVYYYRRIVWHQEVLDRYESQKSNPNPLYEMELNVVRLGDIAICTNSFELFTDFGIQIQCRSKALQTFIIQLVGSGTYLPSERAVKGGHYSAIAASNRVGPDGGKILVEKSVNFINGLWDKQ